MSEVPLDEATWPASALWDFAVATYGRPGVREICLELQDAHGADVCLLLLSRWLVVTEQAPSMDSLGACRRLAAAWTKEVIHPLRRVRRHLKLDRGALPTMSVVPVATIRAAVAAVELASERALLLALEETVKAGAGFGGARERDPLAELWPESASIEPLIEGFVAATAR